MTVNKNCSKYYEYLDAFANKSKYSCRVVEIEYVKLFTYLKYLLGLVDTLSKLSLERKPLVYLACAVSDFFVPLEEMEEHKIQSRDLQEQGLTIKLSNTPKLL